MKKSIIMIIISMIILITIAGAGIFAAGPGGSTMTRTVTPSYGPAGQIFTVKLTATKGSQEMAGIISEIKPSSFEFYEEDNWGGTFDLMVNSIDEDSLDIAFAESGASGYYEYKLQAGSSSGELSGGVTWDNNASDDLGAITLIVCIDNDEDGYSVTGGLCGSIDCDDDNPAINPGAEEIPKNGIDENCDGVDLSFMVVNSPQPAYYNDKKVIFNISLLGEADYLQYLDLNDTRPKNKTLCRDCNGYGIDKKKTKNLVDGEHNLIFYAIKDDKVYEEEINLFIDSKEPKIIKTEPTRGFATGIFSVEFQEENPVSLFLNYGNNATGYRNSKIDLDSCYALRNRKRCDVNISLADYDLQKISYWFNITDVVGRYDESKARKLDVDVSKPVINYFNYTIDKRRVEFVINVTEPNFDEINYIDWANKNPKPVVLCSSLKNGLCKKKESFKKGEHNLTIEVLDKAGNFKNQEVSFIID